MASRKNNYLDWVAVHKKELVIAGIGMIALGTMILVLKNRSTLRGICVTTKKTIDAESIKTVRETVQGSSFTGKKIGTSMVPEIHSFKAPHCVREHPRTLPEGWKPSAEKVAMAADRGYNLKPGQTWVTGYKTGGLVA